MAGQSHLDILIAIRARKRTAVPNVSLPENQRSMTAGTATHSGIGIGIGIGIGSGIGIGIGIGIGGQKQALQSARQL